MSDIYFIKSKVNLYEVYLKIKFSVEDLEKKTPHKKELIKSMKKSALYLYDAYNHFDRLDRRNMSLSSQNFNYELLLLELKTDNRELKKEITQLKNEIKTFINETN